MEIRSDQVKTELEDQWIKGIFFLKLRIHKIYINHLKDQELL